MTGLGGTEAVARRQAKWNPKLCVFPCPHCANDTLNVGLEQRKSASAARYCSALWMSNVLQALDCLKWSQSSFEKLKNRSCCKLSLITLIFEAAEVRLWAFQTRSQLSAWLLLTLLCLRGAQIWSGDQMGENTRQWRENNQSGTVNWSCFSAPDTISKWKVC